LEHRAQGHPGMSGTWAGKAGKGKQPARFGPTPNWYTDGHNYGLSPKGGGGA
jgi:hypothetical protein